MTAEHVEKYSEIIGHYNPLHFDETFAAGTKFGRIVVLDGLTTGILNALVAMDLPGLGTVLLNHDFKFVVPVFSRDTITGEAEVLSVHATKPVNQLQITVIRQPGETVLKGEASCYTLSPDA